MIRLALAGAALCGLTGCRCSDARQPFSCDRLQVRAETCQPEALTQIRQALAARKDRDHQFEMFRYRLNKKLRDKRIEKQCEKFGAAKGPEYERRLAAMKTCYAKADCAEFVRCLLGP